MAAVLLLASLFLIILKEYRTDPSRYGSCLFAWAGIVAGSAFLLILVGIVSSALEIFVTLTTVAMSERLSNRIRREGPWKKAATLWSLTGSRAA